MPLSMRSRLPNGHLNWRIDDVFGFLIGSWDIDAVITTKMGKYAAPEENSTRRGSWKDAPFRTSSSFLDGPTGAPLLVGQETVTRPQYAHIIAKRAFGVSYSSIRQPLRPVQI